MQATTATEDAMAALEAVRRGRHGVRRRDQGRPRGVARRGGRRHRHERRRPARGDVERAALELIARRGPEILATARRYAASPEDAEDAYQRGLEILLTKAPSTSEDDLVPWVKTVVKHEAFALRRQRERHSPLTDDGEPAERATAAAITHDRAALYERLRQSAEALRQLKRQEIRALVLRAEGYSYREICSITGWTYTKVNRCLTEGRRALAIRLAGIEGGIECAKLAPLLACLADGGAGAEAAALVAPHMSSCLSCRARLKAQRATARGSRTERGRGRAGGRLQGGHATAGLPDRRGRSAAIRAEA